MMRMKQLFYSALALMLFLPSFLSYPAHAAAAEGKITSKDEVVYATLNASGSLENVYVVNTLEVARAGEIFDFGAYSSVKNLTDLTEISQEDQTVRMTAPEGKFYYQGNLEDNTELPWAVSISYSLDGQEVEAAELAGKSGHVEISIDITGNDQVDTVFYENYLLQVSLLLSNVYQNIETSGGMVANAGKNKQITFTVMPGKEEGLSVSADVEDFEFQGVDIAAIPSTLPIDTSEMDNMTDDMSELTDAIGKLNDGVAELKDGVSQLNNGAASLQDGSAKYKNGINQLDTSSSELVNGSQSILEALRTINQSLTGQSNEMDLSSLTALPSGLTQLGNGLKEVTEGLTSLQENYALAYDALDGAIQEIPAEQLSEGEIASLYGSGANAEVLDRLMASYAASQKVKITYEQVKEAFAAIEPTLTQISGSVQGMSGQLISIADNLTTALDEMDMSGLDQLQAGLAALSTNYNEFHSGLTSYTKGVSELSSSYSQLHSGISELTGGTSELNSGVVELHDGTEQLYEETEDLPEKMQEEINQMIQEYDKSDFEPVSFVSPQNEKVTSVQFVITTESIKKEEKETKTTAPEKEKGFWELLLDLFR